MIRYERDETKNRLNFRKHGLWFEQVLPVFDDPHGRVFFDENHSHKEERFVILGSDTTGRILIVVHHDRDSENVIRIISARKATKKEKPAYEKRV